MHVNKRFLLKKKRRVGTGSIQPDDVVTVGSQPVVKQCARVERILINTLSVPKYKGF